MVILHCQGAVVCECGRCLSRSFGNFQGLTSCASCSDYKAVVTPLSQAPAEGRKKLLALRHDNRGLARKRVLRFVCAGTIPFVPCGQCRALNSRFLEPPARRHPHVFLPLEVFSRRPVSEGSHSTCPTCERPSPRGHAASAFPDERC